MTDNPFDRLDAETRRVDAFLSGLSPDEWRVESRCPGWDRKAMLAHLSGIEDYIRAGLDGTVDAYANQAGQGVGYEQLNEFLIRRHAETPTDELLRRWREQVAESHPRLRERGVDAVIDTQAGEYPLGRQTWFFACEYAIHADDIAVPVTEAERDDRLAWRLEFARDALAEYGKGVTVEPSGDGYEVSFGDEKARLSTADLVEATSGRLDEDRLPERLRRRLVVLA
ncbi:maleylpyruvate isomerase family mycothiol-dependent enzyme [Stackebrandtia nassauensis]|uniref:maleylpyruvate isomerase family mycothiol-dependent enzyme n=1 Tax=Stackebrandtia nassauensis TaxID=283811 RepID=UPI00145E277D|nr:maleylpyruvate isomerase family mycothiol-dependent enzyme [Stackebrandtia nassauensis]